MRVNLNDRVRVKLNKRGWGVYATYSQSVNCVPRLPEQDGYHTFQLWDLMNIFGLECRIGSATLFVDNAIEFINEEFDPTSHEALPSKLS